MSSCFPVKNFWLEHEWLKSSNESILEYHKNSMPQWIAEFYQVITYWESKLDGLGIEKQQQRFQEEILDEGSNCQQGRMEEESNPNETKTLSEESNRQQERIEEESNLNKMSDKTNKSTSKSSSNKQKQQRFQEEIPSEGSKRQWEKMEEKKESDPNETSDKTNKLTSKLAPIKSILKSAKLTKLTQEESDDKVIEIEPLNIPKVVKDDQGNEKMIDNDDTDLEIGTILTSFI
ncbi:hypothetical protein GLOIN_2v1886406 [Rhizophagus irregularis DAOM 181602=DAOM 197198]|uniref:Uncharacterized protein n=1 Tax=Rhizophagus irregularis (strain DAOM 181602 / DAOM 197198 / MUCL 43194) TaxID=747089 RepID=A0A2P4NX14_RHIID|nr:hypothetical protein GLOIN_2v1886406 [Rhizophagus irregularis DAOM 181602=DAOM 197198]POG57653.1 hypothetical protein GLOIN_2v1886406 [Rhizophagus irregularis DAOM 181602=DAOM 197198]GET57165.1 hypothetical protein GLOIN_2v1886406 [Rhizophagus irregularis DAOM 181602=DAOM 197198]|eukprot:XP_025164519.1 hypothetical protein GLOIN_2v1886406 [Rhizophagus irregularis DAOM 181602=DAOM 197198]